VVMITPFADSQVGALSVMLQLRTAQPRPLALAFAAVVHNLLVRRELSLHEWIGF
jgi:hypothetical protein